MENFNQKIFINFTNHNSAFWGESQVREAEKYGEIIDLPFPNVDPRSTEEEVIQLGETYYQKIIGYHPNAVLCQGEFTLAFHVILRLMESGVHVLAACSERNVVERNGAKTSVFEFVRFREYV